MSAEQLLVWAMAAVFALGAGALLVVYRALRVYDRLAGRLARAETRAAQAEARPHRPSFDVTSEFARPAPYGTPRPPAEPGAPIMPTRYPDR